MSFRAELGPVQKKRGIVARPFLSARLLVFVGSLLIGRMTVLTRLEG